MYASTIMSIISGIVLVFSICGALGEHFGATRNQNILCRQAYAAKVDDKLEACRAWKTQIDNEVNEKLGVKTNDGK